MTWRFSRLQNMPIKTINKFHQKWNKPIYLIIHIYFTDISVKMVSSYLTNYQSPREKESIFHHERSVRMCSLKRIASELQLHPFCLLQENIFGLLNILSQMVIPCEIIVKGTLEKTGQDSVSWCAWQLLVFLGSSCSMGGFFSVQVLWQMQFLQSPAASVYKNLSVTEQHLPWVNFQWNATGKTPPRKSYDLSLSSSSSSSVIIQQ